MTEGQQNPTTAFDFIVFGAGVGGLTVTYKLARAGKRVLLLERQPEIGGVIRSEKRDGYLLESGPNTFTSRPAAIVELIREIGLGDRLRSQPMRQNDRFIWREGKLRKVPMSPVALIGSDVLSAGEKWGAIKGLFKRVPPPAGDIEMGPYFRERIGDGPVDALLKPFMAGVYASDADRVSLAAALPRLHAGAVSSERLIDAVKAVKTPGPKPPPRQLLSFPLGLTEMGRGLAEAIRRAGGSIRSGVESKLSRDRANGFRVDFDQGRSATAGSIVVAAPSWESADLLESLNPRTSELLRRIEYSRLVVVHVGLREETLAEKRNGFGFLSVREQGIRALGMIWSDRIFEDRAPEGHRLLTCFYGGDIDPQVFDWSDQELRQAVIDDLQKSMGYDGAGFELFRITRWERAIPVYRLGHMQLVEEIQSSLPEGIVLLGNHLGGISGPDRVKAAIELAQRLTDESDRNQN